MFKELNEANFTLYAARNYDNPQCTDSEEFHEDLNRIKYIKRLLKKYVSKKELKERLILNHLVVLYNVFEPPALTRMLCFKLQGYEPLLKPFLMYLNYWPENMTSDAKKDDVLMDQHIIDVLRKL
jgi:hypothetical protein